MLLVSLKECRNITNNLGNELFPGWDFQKTPVLFYRPNVQELLINYPHKPKGFFLYTGFNPLGDDTIYVRNDTTFVPYDDQNTSTEVDSIRVLVVADPFSTLRNQLQDMLGRPKELRKRLAATLGIHTRILTSSCKSFFMKLSMSTRTKRHPTKEQMKRRRTIPAS